MSRRSVGRYLGNILYEVGKQYGAAKRADNTYKERAGEDSVRPIFIETVNEKWHSKEEYHREKEKSYWNRYLALNAAIALFTGVGVGFAYKAYCAARSQADSAQTQASEAIKQTNINHEAFVATQRPWVFPEKVEIDFPLSFSHVDDPDKASGAVQIRFTLKTAGQHLLLMSLYEWILLFSLKNIPIPMGINGGSAVKL